MVSNSTIIRPDRLDDDLGSDTNVNDANINSSGVNDSTNINAPPLTVNKNLDKTSTSSIRRPLQTDESDVDFQHVTSKKTQRKQKKSKETLVNQASTNLVSSGTEPGQNCAVDGPVIQNDGINDQFRFSSQQISISKESTRFAQTRYPFPPYVLRFSSGKVTSDQVKAGLIDHCVKIHQTDIQIINCRTSNTNNSNNQYDILVYVKDVQSFSFLLENAHWPVLLGNENFFFPLTPSIPPQLCLLVKNVDLHIDFNEFCGDLKENFPEVKNIIRMKNTFQNDIKMVKLELTSNARCYHSLDPQLNPI